MGGEKGSRGLGARSREAWASAGPSRRRRLPLGGNPNLEFGLNLKLLSMFDQGIVQVGKLQKRYFPPVSGQTKYKKVV